MTEARPFVQGAADEWHRGYELHRAMHRVFFTGGSGGELGSYELSQSRVAGIFDTGRQNCISSAMLYTVLGRSFDMPVRGVLVPTHAFVEVGPPGGRILEVETTSPTGFDLVHDERFFREGAAKWSSSHGLRPVTLDEYQHREIVEPYRLMAAAMAQQSGRPASSKEDRDRLLEAAAVVDPDSAEWQRLRAQVYMLEADSLFKAGAARTIVKMFDCIGPSLTAVMARASKDAKTMQDLAWLRWYYADALAITGRGQEAVAIADRSPRAGLGGGRQAAGEPLQPARRPDAGAHDEQGLRRRDEGDAEAPRRLPGDASLRQQPERRLQELVGRLPEPFDRAPDRGRLASRAAGPPGVHGAATRRRGVPRRSERAREPPPVLTIARRGDGSDAIFQGLPLAPGGR